MSYKAGAIRQRIVVGITVLAVAGVTILGLPLAALAQDPPPVQQLDTQDFRIVGPLPTPDRIAGLVSQGTQDGPIPAGQRLPA